MREIVYWLTGLSKLVPLHSWNGFNNPCLMVETVGRPVGLNVRAQSAETENFDGLEDRAGRAEARKSGSVYSDLGFRSDLMDLMAVDTVEELETQGIPMESRKARASNQFSFSSRLGSTRYIEKERRHHCLDKNNTDRRLIWGVSLDISSSWRLTDYIVAGDTLCI
ncbi:hypothetical protein SAY86_000426 [Trapa natans]|uniref:Uncharacterized protein n=1 Tax=Trapa natans TaxID=22666 RepID=A0AAN7N1E7_TRANT|nr:hypothetical protein SAY86_000426 [Trapa natans]